MLSATRILVSRKMSNDTALEITHTRGLEWNKMLELGARRTIPRELLPTLLEIYRSVCRIEPFVWNVRTYTVRLIVRVLSCFPLDDDDDGGGGSGSTRLFVVTRAWTFNRKASMRVRVETRGTSDRPFVRPPAMNLLLLLCYYCFGRATHARAARIPPPALRRSLPVAVPV